MTVSLLDRLHIPASWTGRLSRMPFLGGVILILTSCALLNFVCQSYGAGRTLSIGMAVVDVLASAAIVVLFARRLHDVGLSDWYALAALVPLLGFFGIVGLACVPGKQGRNAYGDPPSPLPSWVAVSLAGYLGVLAISATIMLVILWNALDAVGHMG